MRVRNTTSACVASSLRSAVTTFNLHGPKCTMKIPCSLRALLKFHSQLAQEKNTQRSTKSLSTLVLALKVATQGSCNYFY